MNDERLMAALVVLMIVMWVAIIVAAATGPGLW